MNLPERPYAIARVERLRRLYNRAYWMQREDPSYDRDCRRADLLIAYRDERRKVAA